jgi:hypothetical protein
MSRVLDLILHDVGIQTAHHAPRLVALALHQVSIFTR